MEEKGNENENKNNIKIILLGEQATGKTNLINAFFGNKFDPVSPPSLSPNLTQRNLKINETNYKINIWDTMGQEKFRSMTKIFLKGAHIVILVYDITKKQSFYELKNFWVKLVENELGQEPIIGLCANKIDLFENEEIDSNEGMEFAKILGAIFCETSAKENPKSFIFFVEKLVKQYHRQKNGNDNYESSISLKNKSKNKKKRIKKKC